MEVIMRLAHLSGVLCVLAGGMGMALPAVAQDSTQCGGMSLNFDGNCGAETRFVRICFGDGTDTTFDLRTGESHRLWVDQGARYNAYCGQEALECPGEFIVALESCSAAPEGNTAPPIPPPGTGSQRPTKGG
jgi:hypothetical protein